MRMSNPLKKPAPRMIGGARVLHFTLIDERHRPTGGCRHTVVGVGQGPAAGLAICQYEGEEGFFLFGCDAEWNSLTDTWHESVEDAMRQAKFEYEGVSETWQRATEG
jgi:hypothetical protein